MVSVAPQPSSSKFSSSLVPSANLPAASTNTSNANSLTPTPKPTQSFYSARMGLAIGIPIGVFSIAFLTTVWWFIRYRHRNTSSIDKLQTKPDLGLSLNPLTLLQNKTTIDRAFEIDTQARTRPEMGAENQYSELSASFQPAELPGGISMLSLPRP